MASTSRMDAVVGAFLLFLPGRADYREQRREWFGTTAIIVTVGRNDGRHGRNRRCQGREGEVL